MDNSVDIRERVRRVKEKLRLSMDGATAARLRGLGYKLVFGVTYPRLRELTAQFEPDAELATRLWGLRQREPMIMATLLYPIEEYTQQMAEEWISDVMNEEIAEYLSRNLLCRLTFAADIVRKLTTTTSSLHRLISYSLLSRLMMQGVADDAMVCTYLAKTVADAKVAERAELSSIALFLKRAAESPTHLEDVKTIASQLSSDSNSIGARWIAEEVQTHIEYSISQD